MQKKILLTLAFVLCHLWLYAQAGISFPSERFSSGLINDICQDKYGYLWIATDYGLNKFDGYRFTTYLHDPADFADIEYYGRGPWENYPDRKRGAFLGCYRMPLSEFETEYIHPQDNGCRTDYRNIPSTAIPHTTIVISWK